MLNYRQRGYVGQVEWPPRDGYRVRANVILFYTDRGCSSDFKAWPVVTQSDDDRYFPENFHLDGINDAISSFMVADEWKVKSLENVCGETGHLGNSSATANDAGSEERSTAVNSTVEYL
ncbi:Epsin-1, required for endocytosis and actin patch assembly [Phytophthora pseudosyringae]|uniref:Epsin-1, required for endocytosis and actin patch assembly n=1 Tax=Phytophthora pseudosyringae TaxID=221518 RepID=A0A8T1VMY5_9STRA|nr:Epsin-1, required for endocytosis and actin patch assembly [Phytophthora pseudosyringae]